MVGRAPAGRLVDEVDDVAQAGELVGPSRRPSGVVSQFVAVWPAPWKKTSGSGCVGRAGAIRSTYIAPSITCASCAPT